MKKKSCQMTYVYVLLFVGNGGGRLFFLIGGERMRGIHTQR